MKPLLKIFIIGDSNVGKSGTIEKLSSVLGGSNHSGVINSKLVREFPTVEIDLDGRRVKLLLWDTLGQERCREFITVVLRHATGIVLMYDVTDAESFDSVAEWKKMIVEFAPANVVTMLIGNKCDMADRRVISKEMGEKITFDHSALFMETSVQANINVEKSFYTMAKAILEKQSNESSNRPGVDLSEKVETKSGCCFL